MKIIAILPAYNAEKTLSAFLSALPKDTFNEVILVDDNSSDNTYNKAKSCSGITVYKNVKNLGYGGNLKKCLALALENRADIIIEIHPDGEYGFDGIVPALTQVRNGAKFILGNRFSRHVKINGMFWWKYVFNKILTFFDNLILGTDIEDLHQGFRVYTRTLLNKINWSKNSEDYIFSFEIIAQAAFKKVKIASVPVSTYYSGTKRGATFKASLRYSLKTFWVLLLFVMAKLGFKNSLFN